jgi:hypothetical protein
MMTIKHIDKTGEEFVYETTHANFVPSANKECAPANASLWRYDADGRAFELSDGRAYLMNSDGNTVATYQLSHTGPGNDLVGSQRAA